MEWLITEHGTLLMGNGSVGVLSALEILLTTGSVGYNVLGSLKKIDALTLEI